MKDLRRYGIGSRHALELVIGDITQETTDAIVNAANSSLLGGGGVDGAIHDAAGPALLEECKKIRAQHGPLPPGRAVGTSGANLKARYVIHTVGPIWQGGDAGEAELLQSCYRESLLLAEQMACASMSFPSVSTGAFGYPVPQAALVAVQAILRHLPLCNSVTLVRFVLFHEQIHLAYCGATERLIHSGKVDL
ncbi:MAG TPA: O-acetyl-ADP-ribose deacetylase [Candidatus Angelobacter sp.]|nr:O-acetyl-ADP-ribose deacetylase [Candidatus Angelobacter sp.]